MLDRKPMLIWSLISIVAAASATIAIERAGPKVNRGLPMGANGLLASGRETTLPGSSGGPASIVIQDNSGKRVEAELITLRPTGFDPAEITRPRGRFLLAVDNRSGLDELVLRIDRQDKGRIHERRMARGKLSWRQVVDLQPGSYLLTEANHPEWVCRITIE